MAPWAFHRFDEVSVLTQAEKAAAFRALHSRDGAFIIPNPWNIGTARLLADAGFEALATTSAGYAFSVGRPDGTIGRDETMAHVAAIVSATGLPVSADLEDGFGDDAETVAETIRFGAEAGLVGGSIADAPKAHRWRAVRAGARRRPHPRGRRRRASAGLSLHTDRACGKLSDRSARPARHDRAASSISERGCRRPLCARPHNGGGHRHRGAVRRSPRECRDGTAGRSTVPGHAIGARRQADQRG